jgi:hypothetical protein
VAGGRKICRLTSGLETLQTATDGRPKTWEDVVRKDWVKCDL